MITVSDDCARLIAIKAQLQRELWWRFFQCPESMVVGSCCQHMRADINRAFEFSNYRSIMSNEPLEIVKV